MKLVGAKALLGGREKVEGQKPLMQRDMAALHDRFHGDAKILPAGRFGAAEHAGALGGIGVVHDAAVSANRARRPQNRL